VPDPDRRLNWWLIKTQASQNLHGDSLEPTTWMLLVEDLTGLPKASNDNESCLVSRWVGLPGQSRRIFHLSADYF
jgi:hypothetical protein